MLFSLVAFENSFGDRSMGFIKGELTPDFNLLPIHSMYVHWIFDDAGNPVSYLSPLTLVVVD